MRLPSWTAALAALLLLAACGDRPEPVEGAALSPGGNAFTHDDADLIEGRIDRVEERVKALEERAAGIDARREAAAEEAEQGNSTEEAPAKAAPAD